MSSFRRQENADLVRAFYDSFDAADLDHTLRLLDETIEWILPGPTVIPYVGSFHGRKEVARFFELLFEHVEPSAFRVDEILPADDCVMALGWERMCVKTTGKAFEMNWADVFQLRDGRIVRFREYCDTAAMAEAYR